MQINDNFLRLIRGGSQAGVFYVHRDTETQSFISNTELTKLFNERRKTKDEGRFDLTVHRDSETQSFYFEHRTYKII